LSGKRFVGGKSSMDKYYQMPVFVTIFFVIQHNNPPCRVLHDINIIAKIWVKSNTPLQSNGASQQDMARTGKFGLTENKYHVSI